MSSGLVTETTITTPTTTPIPTTSPTFTTTQITATTAEPSDANKIIGICVGVVAVAVGLIVVAIVCLVLKRRRNKKLDKKPSLPSADDLQPTSHPQQLPQSEPTREHRTPLVALQPPPVPSSSTTEASYTSLPDETKQPYEIEDMTRSSTPATRDSRSSIDYEYENTVVHRSSQSSTYGDYIEPMEKFPDDYQEPVLSGVNSNDNEFYIDMINSRPQTPPSPEFYQSPDPPPCLYQSKGYVNLSRENVSQDNFVPTALSSSAVIKDPHVHSPRTKPLGSQSQEPVGYKRQDPIGAKNGEVKGLKPKDPKGCKSQESAGARIQEGHLKTPDEKRSGAKPALALKPKNTVNKLDETTESNGAVRQKESLLSMGYRGKPHTGQLKTRTPPNLRKEPPTVGQEDSDENSDSYENMNTDYENTPSKRVEPRRSPAGTPRNLKIQPGIQNREQRQKIGNKQKQ